MRTRNIITIVLAVAMLIAPVGMLSPAAEAAQMEWIADADGNWDDVGAWQEAGGGAIRALVVSDQPRPRSGGYTITISADTLPLSTYWGDSGSQTTSILQTAGNASFSSMYLTSEKSAPIDNYTITGGSLITSVLHLTWNNSGSVTSRFVQDGAATSVTVGNMQFCQKSSTQEGYYDLLNGALIANNIILGNAGSNQRAVFTQSNGTATVNTQVIIGRQAGATGKSIYNLDGGSLTIKRDIAGAPFAFTQANNSYFDFDGGTLNLKGTWGVFDLINYANSDFRIYGGNTMIDMGRLTFTPVDIDFGSGAEAYTEIKSIVVPVHTWNGLGDANWNSPNWLPEGGGPAVLPVADESMVVDSNIVTLDTAASDFSAFSLEIALNSAGGTVEIASPRTLSLASAAIVGDGGVLNVAGSLDARIGVNVASGGEMNVTGSLNAPILKVAGTLNLTGGTETIGSVELTDGALTSDHTLIATSLNASGGVLNLNGNNLTVDNLSLSNSLDMNGGALIASNSITLNNATLTLGHDIATGTLTLDGGAVVGGAATADIKYSLTNIADYSADIVGATAELVIGENATANHLVKLTADDNTYTGTTTLLRYSTLEVSADAGNLGAGLLRFWGGNQDSPTVLQTSGTFSRTIGTGVKWQQHGGFAAVGKDLVVTLIPQNDTETPNAQLIWRDNNNGFSYHHLHLGSPTANKAVTLTNPITLNATQAATVSTFDNPDSSDDIGILSGAITTDGPARTFLKQGVGTLWLQGSNDFGTGRLQINSGRTSVLRAVDGEGLPSNAVLYFNDGVYESKGTFTRQIGNASGKVYWQSRGGFSAAGGALDVTLAPGGVAGGTLIWADTNLGFRGQFLYLNSPTADNVVTLTNDIDASGGGRRIYVTDNPNSDDDYAVISGDITSNNDIYVSYVDNVNAVSGELRMVGDMNVTRLFLADGAKFTTTATGDITTNSVYVRTGSSLGGTGTLTVSGTIDVNGTGNNGTGAIAPGDSVGTLNVAGGRLLMRDSSIYEWEVGLDGAADILNITGGTLDLDKFTLRILDAGAAEITADDELTLFTYESGVTIVQTQLPAVTFDTSGLNPTLWSAGVDFAGLSLSDDGLGRIYLTGLVRQLEEINVTVAPSTAEVTTLNIGQELGDVQVGAAGLLTVDSELTEIAVNNLTLAADSQILASQASADEPAEVMITVTGKLTAEGGVSELGDGDDDDANTNLTLADGAVYDWVFGSEAENLVNISGLLTLEEGPVGITINLIAGSGSADGDEVALLAMFNDPDSLIIPPNIVINKPGGWTFDALEQSADGEYLVLTNLTASAVVARVDGDADGDDDVDTADLAIFKAQFGGEVVGLGDADFNGDGLVTLADFAIMRGNWGATSGAAPTIDDLNATPEPATIIVMLAAGLPALLKRRRRRS
jgi:hypothetical protein